jgi:asparagine synthase (glutamine-hydrolysing)
MCSMKKKGFGLPLKQWMQGSLKSVVENKLEKLKERNIFIPQELNKRHEQYQLGKRNFTEIWQLVAVEMWFEAFIDTH